MTLIPEGMVLLMSVTFAVAAVRLARRDTLVQQMSASESLAAVDTICVDKTGTLTDGQLRLLGVEVAEGGDAEEAEAALGRFAASAGERNRTLETIAEAFPAQPQRVSGEVPFSSKWKWSGLRIGGVSYVLGAPDVLAGSGALTLPPGLARKLEEETSAGRRVVAFASSPEALPGDPAHAPPPPLTAVALVVLEETLRADAAETIALIRSEDVDLKLISGDARATVTAVAHAVGVPAGAGVVEGSELPEDPEELAQVALRNTIFCRIAPEQKKALVEALRASGRYTAMIGDGVNDVPALKQARLAVAMGSGAQVTKGIADVVLLKDEFARLPEAVGEGRRIARNIHRLGRLYLTKSVYAAALIVLVAVPGWAFPFLPRHLTLAAFLTIGVPSFVLALAPSDGPLYRGRLLRALAAFAVPAGLATALGSILCFFLVDTVFGGSLEDGRTAATTTLIVLGLAFVLLLERGPGREHIAIQSYMLAMVAGLGALFALILAAAPVREFFEMSLLTSSQWFLALLCAAVGLTIASVLWRLPYIEGLEAVSPPGGANTNWLTMRFAARRGSAPSWRRSILTSITTVLLPACRGSPTATISSPSTPAAKTLSFSSIVVKLCPAGMLRKVDQAATVSPSAVQTPPWTKPPGCRWRSSTTIRPRACVSSISSGSIPRSPGKLPGRKSRTESGVIRLLGCGGASLIGAPDPTSRRSHRGRSRQTARPVRARPA